MTKTQKKSRDTQTDQELERIRKRTMKQRPTSSPALTTEFLSCSIPKQKKDS